MSRRLSWNAREPAGYHTVGRAPSRPATALWPRVRAQEELDTQVRLILWWWWWIRGGGGGGCWVGGLLIGGEWWVVSWLISWLVGLVRWWIVGCGMLVGWCVGYAIYALC